MRLVSAPLAALLAALLSLPARAAQLPIVQAPYFPSPHPAAITSSPATVRQVTNRTAIPNAVGSSSTQVGWRSWQMAYVNVSAIEVCVPNFYVAGATSGVETGAGGVATHRIAIEYPHGTFTTVTWSGAGSGNAANLSTLCSDLTPLPTPIPAFTRFRVGGDVNFASGGHPVSESYVTACDRANGDEFLLGASGYGHYADDVVLGNANPSAAAQCFHPALVMALSNRSVWGLVGDSIVAGINDVLADPSGGRGMFGRAVALLSPQINNGVSGDRAAWYATGTNAALRTAILATGGATSVLLQHGVNDFFSGSSSADTLLTNRASVRAAIVAAIPGIHVFDTTVTPDTSSSDGFQTTANQTTVSVSANNYRAETNDILRGFGSSSYQYTCTENATTALTGCGNMSVSTVAAGMLANGTNIPSNDVVTAVNQVTGAVTLTSAATGSGAQTITFTWPTFSTSWPTTSAGLIDVARLVEGSPNQAATPISNGGVWLPGYVGPADGIHLSSFGITQVEQLIMNQMMMLR